MDNNITIVDRGRGPQLSTSRISVQDLVPYLQENCPHEEILYVFPSLTGEEIAVVERYYHEHKQEMDEQEREIRERTASRLPAPEVQEQMRKERLERLAHARVMIRQSQRGLNGDSPSR